MRTPLLRDCFVEGCRGLRRGRDPPPCHGVAADTPCAAFVPLQQTQARESRVDDFAGNMAKTLGKLGAALRRGFARVFDTKAHREAEERWRLIEERLRLATEAGKVGVWDWDIERDRVTWTGALYAIHGIEQGIFGEMPASALAQLIYPEDRETVQGGIVAALRSGQPRYEAEFRTLRTDGEVVWIYVTAQVIRRNDGRAVRMVGATVDIDDRKRMELALRESDDRLRLALRAANAGVWEINLLTGETFWSDEFRDLYGYDRSVEPSRKIWGERLHPEDREHMLTDFSGRLKPGTSEFHREFRIVHPSRGVRWIHASGHVERDARGRATRMRGISIDITRIKQVEEELREADRRKNEFLATLAHELRNPLAPIRNGLEILRLAPNAEVAERARSMMDRQLHQLVRLIDDLLEVSRITSGKIQLNRELTDLSVVLQTAVEMSKPLIDAAGHEITIEVPQRPLIVDGDPLRLAQVFGNLLNNAAKYTNPGGRIWLVARTDGDRVSVVVRDNGIGIPREVLPRVFELFTQANHMMQQAQGGLGIGLSIAKRLVEMHGGTLEAHSEGLGTGSQFTVRLPLCAAGVVASSTEEQVATAGTVEPLRILVADDNADAAASLAMLLKMNGHEVRTAFDGEEALRIAQELEPDVALLDIGMPLLDGYEVCRRLRASPFGRDMTIVALTGWGQTEDRERSRAAGFDRHLVKPADLREVEELLAQASVIRDS